MRLEYAEIAPSAPLTRNDAQAGLDVPDKRNDAAQRGCWRDREAAGQIGPAPTLLFNHDEFSSLFHRASVASRFGSVSVHSNLTGKV